MNPTQSGKLRQIPSELDLLERAGAQLRDKIDSLYDRLAAYADTRPSPLESVPQAETGPLEGYLCDRARQIREFRCSLEFQTSRIQELLDRLEV
jgi:hypothetical protein